MTPSLPRRDARYSGNVSKSQLTPDSATGDMPSTLANMREMKSRSASRVGAMQKPQLPASTVVTPW